MLTYQSNDASFNLEEQYTRCDRLRSDILQYKQQRNSNVPNGYLPYVNDKVQKLEDQLRKAEKEIEDYKAKVHAERKTEVQEANERIREFIELLPDSE